MCEKYMYMVLSQRLRIAQEEGTHEKPVVTVHIPGLGRGWFQVNPWPTGARLKITPIKALCSRPCPAHVEPIQT